MRTPRLVFSDGLEERLIALWVEYQTKKSGVMMKRAKKEIAEKLNLYAKEIGENMEFSPSVVHNKIDNLKSKAKDHYKKFRRATATGSAVDPASARAKASIRLCRRFAASAINEIITPLRQRKQLNMSRR